MNFSLISKFPCYEICFESKLFKNLQFVSNVIQNKKRKADRKIEIIK